MMNPLAGWNRLGAEFTEEMLEHLVHRLVDLWHLLEKLGTATRLLHRDKEGAWMLSQWHLSLLNDDNALQQILETLQDSGKSRCAWGTAAPCTKPSLTFKTIERL